MGRLEQDSRAGQPVESLDRTAETRQPGQDSQERKAGTGELGKESQKETG
jgi:hypothetical protein